MDKQPADTPDISRSPEFAKELDHHLGTELADLTPPNRAQKRAQVRAVRKIAVRADAGIKRLHHPLTGRLTPWGVIEMKRRRAAEKAAKKARQVNHRRAA